MNFRRRLVQEPISFQLAPFIDVVMFLLCFFLLTWNIARYETDLKVKIPSASHGKEPKRLPGEAIVNVRQDGSVTLQGRACWAAAAITALPSLVTSDEKVSK